MKNLSTRNIPKSIFFFLISFGIYGYVWMYWLVRNTRVVRNRSVECTNEMLCLIFIPFYRMYWWYTMGEKIKRNLTENGYEVVGNGTLYMILSAVGLDLVAMAVMQDGFNATSAKAKVAASNVQSHTKDNNTTASRNDYNVPATYDKPRTLYDENVTDYPVNPKSERHNKIKQQDYYEKENASSIFKGISFFILILIVLAIIVSFLK